MTQEQRDELILPVIRVLCRYEDNDFESYKDIAEDMYEVLCDVQNTVDSMIDWQK